MSIKEQVAWYAGLDKDLEYKIESKKIDFAVQLEQLLIRHNIKKTEFASLIGTSAAYISKVLRGDANVTIETMVKLADAAGGEYHCYVSDKGRNVLWVNAVPFEVKKGYIVTAQAALTASNESGSIGVAA